jgi:hypothetical protein
VCVIADLISLFRICGFKSVVFDCEQEGKRIHCEESSEIYKNELRVMNKR